MTRTSWSTQTTRSTWSTRCRLHRKKILAIIELLAQGTPAEQICEALRVSAHSVEVIRVRDAAVIALLKLKDPDSSDSRNQVSEGIEAAVTFGKCIDELVSLTREPAATIPTLPVRSKERPTFEEMLEQLPSS
jgi:hypothetical protein